MFWRTTLVIALGAVSLQPAIASPQTQQGGTQAGKLRFVKPVALRGTLGDAQIQVNLRTKEEFADGVEGDYFLFGHSNKILLAGEIEGDELFLEESENGVDVSGQWSGKLTGDVLSGEWESVDGTIRKSFKVAFVPGPEGKKQASTGKNLPLKKQ